MAPKNKTPKTQTKKASTTNPSQLKTGAKIYLGVLVLLVLATIICVIVEQTMDTGRKTVRSTITSIICNGRNLCSAGENLSSCQEDMTVTFTYSMNGVTKTVTKTIPSLAAVIARMRCEQTGPLHYHSGYEDQVYVTPSDMGDHPKASTRKDLRKAWIILICIIVVYLALAFAAS